MNRLKEYLLEALQQTDIFEMAESRKELKKDIDGLIKQIIENWCLVKYCSLYDPNHLTKNHWKNELESHMINIFEKKLKSGDSDTKYKVIHDWVIDSLEINTAFKIQMIMRRKIKKENLKMPDEIYELCIEELDTLLCLMSNKYTPENYNNILDYVESL